MSVHMHDLASSQHLVPIGTHAAQKHWQWNPKHWEQTQTFNPVFFFSVFLLFVISSSFHSFHSVPPLLLPCFCSAGWKRRAGRTTFLPSSGRRTETGRNSSTLSSSSYATSSHSTTPRAGARLADGPSAASCLNCFVELGEGRGVVFLSELALADQCALPVCRLELL